MLVPRSDALKQERTALEEKKKRSLSDLAGMQRGFYIRFLRRVARTSGLVLRRFLDSDPHFLHTVWIRQQTDVKIS